MTVDPAVAVNPRVLEDRRFMALALDMARAIPVRPWPNPPVGAVVVAGGRVVGAGAHHGPGTPHAEQAALDQAGAAAAGATLYVTLEPCNHTGRTPPCAPAVAAAGIRRAVVAMRDPNPRVTGGGCRFLRECGLEVTCGVLAADALDLVWPFVATGNFARPYVELKTAQSLDGCFAPDPGGRDGPVPHYLTGEDSRREVHRRRCWMDAVLVGEGTARADRPRLDTRLAAAAADGPRSAPKRGYLDTDLSFAEGLAGSPFLVIAGSGAASSGRIAALTARGAEIIFVAEQGGHTDPAAVIKGLQAAGVNTLMIEGGPRLAAAFLASGLVDRWCLYTAPVFLGRGIRWPDSPAGSQGFSLSRVERIGQDTLSVYDRRNFNGALQEVTL